MKRNFLILGLVITFVSTLWFTIKYFEKPITNTSALKRSFFLRNGIMVNDIVKLQLNVPHNIRFIIDIGDSSIIKNQTSLLVELIESGSLVKKELVSVNSNNFQAFYFKPNDYEDELRIRVSSNSIDSTLIQKQARLIIDVFGGNTKTPMVQKLWKPVFIVMSILSSLAFIIQLYFLLIGPKRTS